MSITPPPRQQAKANRQQHVEFSRCALQKRPYSSPKNFKFFETYYTQFSKVLMFSNPAARHATWANLNPPLQEFVRSRLSPEDLQTVIHTSDESLAIEKLHGVASEFEVTADTRQPIAELLANVLAFKQKSLGTENTETLSSMAQLAGVQDDIEAEKTWKSLLEIKKKSGARPDFAAMYNLSLTLNQQGKYEEAEPILKEVLQGLDGGAGGHGKHRQLAIGTIRELVIALGGVGKFNAAKEAWADGMDRIKQAELSTVASTEYIQLMKDAREKIERWEVEKKAV
jgi:tetratricopeptide (TPR) repeat protein